MRYLPSEGKFVADSLSRTCEIHFSKFTESELWVKLQTEDKALKVILDGKFVFSGK